MAKKGRPEIWDPLWADKICERLANGDSLRTVCKDPQMPGMTTVFKWLREHDEFAKQYARATEERAEAFAEDILVDAENAPNVVLGIDKSDNARVNAVKIKIDTKKWLMAKMKPKKYGEKLDLTSDGKALPQPIYGGVSKKDK